MKNGICCCIFQNYKRFKRLQCKSAMPGITISVIIVFFLLPCKGKSVCSQSICLQWTITENCLKLICQINDIYLSVSIADPNGNIQAECFPPFQRSCEPYYRNGTIQYNVLTKEVIFTVRGTINNKLDGYWACRHGLKGDRTVAFVSVNNRKGAHIYPVKTTTTSSQMTSTETEKSKDLEASTINGTSTEAKNTRNSLTTSSPFIGENTKELKHSRIYGPLAGGLVLFLSLFVGLNIWISRKCRSVNLKNGQEFMGPNISNSTSNVNTNTQPPQIENNLSEYETINENEMIQVPDDLDMPNETEATSVSSPSITSDSTTVSDRSYLEVVHYSFYSNPYETLQSNTDSDSVHIYSITDQFECKLDSSSTEASICPQRNCRSELKQEIVTDFPEHSSLPTISDESIAIDDNLILDKQECGAPKTSSIMNEMDSWNISDKAKTNPAMPHSLSKSISNYQDMSGVNSNQSFERPSSSKPINAMSTLL